MWSTVLISSSLWLSYTIMAEACLRREYRAILGTLVLWLLVCCAILVILGLELLTTVIGLVYSAVCLSLFVLSMSQETSLSTRHGGLTRRTTVILPILGVFAFELNTLLCCPQQLGLNWTQHFNCSSASQWVFTSVIHTLWSWGFTWDGVLINLFILVGLLTVGAILKIGSFGTSFKIKTLTPILQKKTWRRSPNNSCIGL